MNIDDFSTYWNKLFYTVRGRGTVKPANVSQSLYDLAGSKAQWQQWYTTSNMLDASALSANARAWIADYRQIAALAKKEGHNFAEAPKTLIEWLTSTSDPGAKGPGSLLMQIALVGGAITLVQLVVMVATRPGSRE
jgi:ABC-type Fe3+-hydroxamate transport system substrate-binding protein